MNIFHNQYITIDIEATSYQFFPNFIADRLLSRMLVAKHRSVSGVARGISREISRYYPLIGCDGHIP